jgi:hypothetical protein
LNETFDETRSLQQLGDEALYGLIRDAAGGSCELL